VQKTLQDSPDQFIEHKGVVIYWQTNSKNCDSFLMRGSRQPEIQRIVTDIKCKERHLDISIVPVWTPRTHARIVTADLGSKLSSSVADPDPGSGAFLTPGSRNGIRNRLFSGSRIPNPYF
jgi:hypothetical protein